jgi:hypothetical protein
MTSYGGLASTGFAITIGGLTLGPLGLVGAATALVALGALSLRLGWRRGRELNAR